MAVKSLKLFFYLLLLIRLFFAFNSKVSAAEWIKYQDNPIFSSGSSPTIISDNNLLKMWYQNFENNVMGINYSESTDGIHWQDLNKKQVIIPQNEDSLVETGMVEPCVIKNDLYRMWYKSENGSSYHIRYATSSDGISWTKHVGYILTGSNAWEANAVANPSVIFKDNKYYMWYMGHGSGSWKIGLAESDDGINWTKYSNNPLALPNLGHVGGQSVIYTNGKFSMFYHTGNSTPTTIYHVISDDGINWKCDDDCAVLSISEGFDSNMVVYPEVINFNSNQYLYYAGFNGSIWQIGLASVEPIQDIKKDPVIIIPGLFASWDKKALIYNQNIDIVDWKINPFVHEYDGLIQSLKNLGYQENKDFYVFAYDWRKNLNRLADDFKTFLDKVIVNNSDKKINIIGHSLGGLVGRIYAQKYGTNNINKVITVGSPHQGVAQVYKAVEAGEIDRYDNFLWLSEKLILQIYKDGLKTDKQIIDEKIPVLKDLFPIYDFLKDKNNQNIEISDMTIKNTSLTKFNSSIATIYPVLNTVAGEKGSTLFGYKISSRTTIDELLDYYPDGKPIESLYNIGDYSVLSSSAQTGNNSKTFNLGHNELIYKSETIKEILNELNISYQDNQIIEGTGTTISPSLLFLVFSPVKMSVVSNNNTYIENDGLIFIENAQSQAYHLTLTGEEKGSYQVLIAQIGTSGEQWSKISGQITKENPSSQIDTYEVNFNQDIPVKLPISFDLLIYQLIDTNTNINNRNISNSIKYLKEAKKYYYEKKFFKEKLFLEKAHQEIFFAAKSLDQNSKQKLFKVIDDIEYIYSENLKNSHILISKKKLEIELKLFRKAIISSENFLLFLKRFGIDITKKAILAKTIEDKIKIVEDNLKSKNYYYCEIVLKTVASLIKELK